ncbi:hypothetical protein ACF09L_17305 [Streptomyces sp. NPDC014779]|uniref:hypothetical protein n=1 Tax=Streptomyces sp. NPDC014779 TaxID=3364911 RepID=UPI0036F86141
MTEDTTAKTEAGLAGVAGVAGETGQAGEAGEAGVAAGAAGAGATEAAGAGDRTDTARGASADGASAVPPSRLRRLLRSRTARTATVAALVGALLGAGTVAWRTDTLPLVGGAAPCWDSFDEETMKGLFGERETRVEEQVLESDDRPRDRSYGECRITSYKGERMSRRLRVDVHVLDGLYGTDAHRWPGEFLTSRMVPLGEGLPGMTSAERAWLALPESCTGRVGEFEGATVVDLSIGSGLDIQWEYQAQDRTDLTRALVAAANGVMRDLGCSGAYRVPDRLPALPERGPVSPAAFCGVAGLRPPAGARESLTWSRSSGDGGPARVCEAGYKSLGPSVRLTTVADRGLSALFGKAVRHSGTKVKGTKGYGSFNANRAVYAADCQTGRVLFMVEQMDSYEDDPTRLTRELLPAYVAAEAERIGCGPEKVTAVGTDTGAGR